MDIFLLDAVVNGMLLGGVLALLALGLNLIFGVIDVVWIAYAELVMCGMYAIYWLFTFFHWPLVLACVVAILGVALLGLLVHLLIIEPMLGSPPINQLLATGGLLFFLQSLATLLFGTDFRNLGLRLPLLEWGGFYCQFRAITGVCRSPDRRWRAVSVFEPQLSGNGDPRHRPGPRDHGADGRQSAADLSS